MNEVWKDVVGYEGLYEVSNIGNVRSMRRGTRIVDKENRIMRQKKDDKGYWRVNLYKNKKCKAALVSRLVAKAFIDNPSGYNDVGHMDDDKNNNAVENLYWTYPAENLSHNGLRERITAKRQLSISKIAESISIPVVATNIKTGEKVYFKSMREAQRNGFKTGKISMCCAGKRNMHKGFRWEKQELDRKRKGAGK